MGCGSSKVAPLLTSHASATGDTVVGAAFLLDGCPVAGEEPAASTDDGLCLLIIDPQNDFHPPNGSLAVPGAVEDTERVIAMLNRLSDQITNVVVSLDSHNPLHIANPGFWRRGDDGSYARPKPFTIITAKEVKDGAWEAADPALTVWAQRYAEQLEAGGRFKICIWPEHCLVGTEGHNVYPPLSKALEAWGHSKSKSVQWLFKGQNNRTEMYSALKAEVVLPDDPATALNTELIARLSRHRKVVICGQAKSHCVNYTARDLLAGWPKGRPASDIVVISDGCSSVPGFEQSGVEFEGAMKKASVTVTTAAAFAG